jgi:lipoyl(octanoyl) transferase
MSSPIHISQFHALQAYQPIYELMRTFTHARTENSVDEIWLLEHEPVFTQGQAGKSEHILNPGNIPVVQSDRGGQVTYHGPGQLMIYTLCDLKRLNVGIRAFVVILENTIIELLKGYGITAQNRCDAPGVYVDNAKICSLGLRVRRGNAYHGLSLNVKMDLTPFSGINPCGFKQLAMTQISDFVPDITMQKVIEDVMPILLANLKTDLPHNAKLWSCVS